MDSVKYVSIAEVMREAREDGEAPLFSFAIDDYISKYNISQPQLDEWGDMIFGAVLDDSDFDKIIPGDRAFSSICKLIFDLAEHVDLFVFDISNVSAENVEELRARFGFNFPGYEELKNVYESRIVFAASDINMRSDEFYDSF